MRYQWCYYLAVMLLLGNVHHGDEIRKWTSANGKFSTEAKLIEVRGGDVVLERVDGKQITVPKAKLGPADRKHLAALAKASSGATKEPATPVADAIRERIDMLLRWRADVEFAALNGPFKNDGHIVALALSDKGNRLAACSAQGDCRVWDIAGGKELAKYEKDLSGNNSFSVAISPDGKLVFVGGSFGAVHVWDAETGKHLFTHEKPEGFPYDLNVSADGARMSCIDSTGQFSCYPSLGGLGTSGKLDEYAKTGTYCDVSPDGKYLVTGRSEHSDAVIVHLPREGFPGAALPMAFPEKVLSIDIAERFTAMGTTDHRVALQEIGTKEGELVERVTVTSRIARAYAVSVARDSGFIMAANHDGYVDTWQTDVQGFPCTFHIPVTNVAVVCLSAESRTVAYGCRDGTIAVYRLAERPTMLDSQLAVDLYDMVTREKFAEAERFIAALREREPRPHWRDASQRDAAIVFALTRVGRRFDDRDEHLARLAKWSGERSAAPWPKLALAQIAIEAGWAARGSGFASTVTELGGKTFRERIDAAEKLVLPIADSDNPPAACYQMIAQIAAAKSWDPARVDAYIKKMMTTFSGNTMAHGEVAVGRLPRWGGRPEDAAAYMQAVADQIGGDAGDQVYAEVGLKVLRFDRIDRLHLDEARLVRGLESLCREFPNDTELANVILQYALTHENRPLAKLCADGFTSKDTQWSVGIWKSRDRFNIAVQFGSL